MAIAWKSHRIETGETGEFHFDDGVIFKQIAGIQAFQSKYKEHKHHKIKYFGIELQVTKPNDHQINVRLTQTLQDGSSNKLDKSTSWAMVTVVVSYLPNDDTFSLSNIDIYKNGSLYETLLGKSMKRAGAFLGSFYSDFSGDHDIHSVSGSSSAETQELSAIVGGSCVVKKEEKTISTPTILETNLIAITEAESIGAAMRMIQISPKIFIAGGITNDTGSVEFDFEIGEVAVLITSYEMSYGSGINHNVGTIMAGAAKWEDSVYKTKSKEYYKIDADNPKKMTIYSNASMYEMKNSTTIKNQSVTNNVTYLVLAMPKP